MAFSVPEQLESDRLLLRQIVESDLRGLHEYYSDEKAVKFTFGQALTEVETWRTMCCMIGHWHIRGYGPYVVEEKSSALVTGIVGFWYPYDWPGPEIKWALSRAFWGRGYAKEAAALVHSAGREYLPDQTLISLIHQDNKPSIGVALAIGASFEDSMDFKGEPHVIYRHKATV